MPRKLLNRI